MQGKAGRGRTARNSSKLSAPRVCGQAVVPMRDRWTSFRSLAFTGRATPMTILTDRASGVFPHLDVRVARDLSSPMPARSRPTWLPWWFLLLGVLWAPGGAIAHGVAHQRQAAQRVEHERWELLMHGAQDALGLESGDHHGDHDDITSDDGVPAREGAAAPAASRVVVLPAWRFERARCQAACVYAARPRADPDTGPPPQLRAPPTV